MTQKMTDDDKFTGGGEINKHTPGPWIEFADQGDTVAILPAMCEGTICEFQSTVTRANARLIAAAPDLLEALIKLMRWMDGSEGDEQVPPVYLVKARAAIARATEQLT